MAIGGDGSATANAHIDHFELGLMSATTLSIQGINIKEVIGALCMFY